MISILLQSFTRHEEEFSTMYNVHMIEHPRTPTPLWVCFCKVSLVPLQTSCKHYTTWVLPCTRMLHLFAPQWYGRPSNPVRQAPM